MSALGGYASDVLAAAEEFTEKALRWGVTNEDGEPMTVAEAANAIESVQLQIREAGGRTSVGHAQDWWEIEALVLDRFGFDPDAFEPDHRAGETFAAND